MIYGQYRGQLLGALVLTAAAAAPAFAQTAAPTPTFTKDVAPIFQAKCESCHRPDSIAPMSLVTYEQSRPWARSIRDRVADAPDAAVAPRQDASASSTSRTTARSATHEIDTIVKWVAAGAPKGDPKDMPPAGRVAERRRLELREARTASPTWSSRRRPTRRRATRRTRGTSRCSATGLTEARWVRAIEMRPGTVKGRKITHHALARLQQNDGDDGSVGRAAGGDDPGPGLFMEWAVGKQGEIMRAELRQADDARLEDRVGHPLPRRRRGHHRLGRARHLLLPEGPGAEVPPDAGALQRHHRRQPRPRHRARTRSTCRRTST